MGGVIQRVIGLHNHPNYEQPELKKGEDTVAFVLRCAAHLISPPQIEGESIENECTDIAEQILQLESAIREAIMEKSDEQAR